MLPPRERPRLFCRGGTRLFLQKRMLARSVWGLRQARALTPWVSDIHLHLGLAYSERRHFKRAAAAFRNAARVQPGSADPWGYLAFAAAKRNDPVEVLPAYLRVLENLSSASADSLAALSESAKSVEQWLLQIREFFAEVPQQARTKHRLAFIAWVALRFWHYSHLLSGRRLRLLQQGPAQMMLFQRNPQLLEANIALWAKNTERAAA